MSKKMQELIKKIIDDDLFKEYIKDESTIIAGPSSELDSLLMVQLIAYLEEYAEENKIEIDLIEFIMGNDKNLSLGEILFLIDKANEK